MPVYRVKAPDGSTYRIEAPDGASEADAIAYAQQQFGGGAAKPRVQSNAAQLDAINSDPASGMSTFEKYAANFGAGMADIGLGARQRYADWFGSDADKKRLADEVEEKRRIDKQLAGTVWGGGFTQGAGTAVPMMLANTLLPGAGSLVGATAGGAATGAATGYLAPTGERESAGKNALWGGVVGGALPLAVSGARGAVRWVRGRSAARAAERIAGAMGGADAEAGRTAARELADRAAQAATQRTTAPTAAGATDDALQALLGQGDDAAANAARLQAAGTGDIPLSVAARTQSPELARLEQASRLRNPELWAGFDETQARALADRLRTATGEADQVVGRVASRGAAYQAARQRALDAVDQGMADDAIAGMRTGVENAMNLPGAVNSDVRAALREARAVLDTPGVSAEHLMELRKELSAGLRPGNVLRSADRSNPAILSTVRAIDETLDAITGGQWRPVNAGFTEASAGVDAGRAAQKVRDVFFNPATGLANKTARTAAGDVPEITEAGLRTAQRQGWDAARRASRFSPETQAGLDELSNAVRAQNIIQRLQRTATAGGGSGTASNLTALAQEEGKKAAIGAATRAFGPFADVARGAVRAGDALLNARADAMVARALQNPQDAQRLFAQMQGPMDPALRQSLAQALAQALRELPGKAAWGAMSAVPAEMATDN